MPKQIRFISFFKSYNPGETATFDDKVADAILGQKKAVLVPSQPEPTPEPAPDPPKDFAYPELLAKATELAKERGETLTSKSKEDLLKYLGI